MRGSPPDGHLAALRAGTRVAIAVPPAGRLYEGHFPGRPILPGVGLLDLALRAMAGTGAPPALRGIAALRLRRLVAPGDALDLEVQACDADGRARLEVRRAAEVVASGLVFLGDPSPGMGAVAAPRDPQPVPGAATDAHEGAPHAPAPRRPADAPLLDDLLPHRPSMRFVEGIETDTGDGVACAVRVSARNAFNEGGSAPALVALEMAAQSAALYEALRRLRQGGNAGPRVGYLVGARDVQFTRARVPAGETLLATVRLSGMALPLCTYSFDVAWRSEVVASGTVSTWLTATGA